MELNKKHIPILLAVFVAGLIIGGSFTRCGGSHTADPKPVEIHDTISLTDTIIKEKIRIVSRSQVDTFIVHARDSVRDTIKVGIPIETKLYADRIKSDSGIFDIGIKYTGYMASLDSVGISYHASIKPAVKEKKRGFGQFVGIGIGVGYGGTMIDQRIYAAPYVGVHLTYGFGYTWRK